MSGMGYIFTQEGLRILYGKLVNNTCKVEQTYEDKSFGRCLADVVLQVDTRDEHKRQKFLHEGIDSEIAIFNDFHGAAWIKTHAFYHFRNGLDCCSPMMVGTHHLDMNSMFLYNNLIRNVSVFGKHKFSDEPKLPKKYNRADIALSTLDTNF